MTDGVKDVPVKSSISGYRKIDIPILVTLQKTITKDIPIKVTLRGDSVLDVPTKASLETYRVDYGMYGESIYETAPRQSIFYAQGGTPDKTIAVTDPYWFLKSGDTESGTEGFMELGIGQITTFDETDANLTAFVRVTADGGAQVKIKPGIVLMPTTSAPSQIEGMLYYNDTSNKLNFWDGDSWEVIDTGAGAPDPHGSGSHTGQIFPGANQDLGAFYMDIGEISTPSNPGANVRRIFLDDGTNELSVRTTGGATISLEGAGGGAHVLATSGPHTGTLPWADMAVGTQGGIVRRGAADWEEYALGTETYVLKAGATDVAWGTVDWGELTGSQPSPISHDIVDHDTTATGAELTELTDSSETTLHSHVAGGGPGSGTQYTIPRWATTTTLGDSILSEDSGGSELTVNGHVNLTQSELRFDDDDYEKIAYISGTPNRGVRYTARGAASGWYGVHEFYTGYNGAAAILAARFKDTNLEIVGDMTIGSITAGVSDYDAFLVSDSGVVKFRTGTEVLSDIGAAATGEAHTLATSGPHTDTLPFADLAVGSQGSIIRRGGADWEEYTLGTETYVLKSGATDVAWGTVDWSELSGSQPAPISHDFDSHSGDVDLADIASYTQGSIIRGGGSDWEAYTLGTETYVLKAGATDIAWGQVDYSELSGTQPAPVAHVLATTGPHSSSLPLTDIASYVQGSIIKGGASDWEALGAGTEDYVLKMGASEPAWGQVDYSELTGSAGHYTTSDFTTDFAAESLANLTTRTHASLSDAPENAHHPKQHAIDSTTEHSATGLTTGWVLSADSATTYSWKAQIGGISGTQWTLPVFDTTTTIGDSMISQDSGGTQLTISADMKIGVVTGDSTVDEIKFLDSPLSQILHSRSDGSLYIISNAYWESAVWTGVGTYSSWRVLYDTGSDKVIWAFSDTGTSTPSWVNKMELTGSAGNLQFDGSLTVGSIVAGVSDYDTFLVSDSGVVKFRTGTEILSDIGAAAVPLALTDIASYTQGSIIIGGGADWEPLVAGTDTYVLKMGATEPAWGTVDWSELTGSQPAPISHDYDVHSGDLDIYDISGYVQGSIIIGGAVDWEAYGIGTETYVLKAGASEPIWGTVDWSELTGSQPSPISHDFDVHSGDVDITDIASYVQGSIIIGGSADWEALGIGTETYVLKAGASEPSWGTVDWSELSGSQPSPISHDLTGDHTENATGGAGNVIVADSTTTFSWQQLDYSELAGVPSTFDPDPHDLTSAYHTDSGLTAGHFLKATGTTTFAFGAHGLTASDVGASPALSGTQWTLPVFDTTTTLGDSLFRQSAGGTIAFVDKRLQINDDATNLAYILLYNDINDGNPYIGVGAGGAQVAQMKVTYNTGTVVLDNLNLLTKTSGTGNDGRILFSPDETLVLTLNPDTTATFVGAVTLSTINAGVSDYDKFLVSDSGEIKFRTGSEVLSDIGGAATGEAHVLATSGPHTGTLPWADMAAGTQGGIVRRGATDWEEYALGTETYVLKAGATDVAWGTVDWSELSGSQPSPVSHDFDVHSGDVDLADIASYTQGSIIIGGGADWQALGLGTNTYVLKSGATDVAWGQVDYSELSGSQPAPIAHVLATSGPHTGTLPLADLAVGTQGGIIRRGAADWEEYALGTETYVLKAGATDVAWGTVDWGELSGTQPAPVAHVLASASHTVSGLTAGDILSADSATTYSWKVNPAATVPLALTDLASYTQGSIIIGGGSDWEALVSGTEDYVLTMGVDEPYWAVSASGGPGSGTQYAIPRWATTTTLGDSLITTDSGNTLATVTGNLTVTGVTTVSELNTDAEDNIVNMSAAEVWYSGGTQNPAGYVESDATVTVVSLITHTFPSRFAGGAVELEKIVIYFWTEAADAGDGIITATRLEETDWSDGTESNVYSETTDRGAGASGYDNYTIDLSDHTMLLDSTYRLEVDIVSTGANYTVRIWGFRVYYTLT
jgi:hypothetical protein